MLAEGVGFEPTLRFPVNTLSKRAPSATRPPLQLAHKSQIFLYQNARYALLHLSTRPPSTSRQLNRLLFPPDDQNLRPNEHIYVLFSNIDRNRISTPPGSDRGRHRANLST